MPANDPLQDEIDEIPLLEARITALTADLRQKKDIILAQHTKLEAFFDSSIDAVVQMDFDGYITGWNHQAEKIFGWRAEEILEQTIEQTIIPERYREAHRNGMQRYLGTGESTVLNSLVEIYALHRDGHEFPIELSVSVINSTDLQEFNAYIRDISGRKEAENIVWNQANFDSLTNLPNRNLFLQRLEHEALSCDRSKRSLALLYIDLDRFKDVNDSLGHDMGDKLLVEVSRRLKNTVREIDTVSRLSGDEFTIILGQIDDQLSVQRVCQQLLDRLSAPLQLDTEVVHLTASIGVSFYPEDATETEALQRQADQAMYSAKTQGRNRYQFFTAELQQRALRKRQMITDLHEAVSQSRFEVHYQPIVSLLDGSITRAEALLRWQHPESGVVIPSVFIPIAEETGLINEIGTWVFLEACTQVKKWRAQFDRFFQISINTSHLQWIDETAHLNQWINHLHEQVVDGSAIILEITEDLLMNPRSRITNRLIDFRNAGIQLSIDDFGTGYSSLSCLKQFDIDYLKIDQSFVRNLDQDNNDAILCEAMIAMAHKLDIKVIAEGVETRDQDRLLREFGCDFGQGYLYSKAVSAAELESLLGEKS
jgi:diguanylate cyclase (GGDEF)-like protein/PAS domain S-box-containing protein